MGLLLAVVVHSAGIQDRTGARAVLVRLFPGFGTIQTVLADGGYTGKLIDWTHAMFGWLLTVVKRTDAHSTVKDCSDTLSRPSRMTAQELTG
jgi:hypothetical protein